MNIRNIKEYWGNICLFWLRCKSILDGKYTKDQENNNCKISQYWLDHKFNSILGGKYGTTQGVAGRQGQLINIGCNLSKIALLVSSFLEAHFYQGHFSYGASYLREIFVRIRRH